MTNQERLTKSIATLNYSSNTPLPTLKRYAAQFLNTATKRCPLSKKAAASFILNF